MSDSTTSERVQRNDILPLLNPFEPRKEGQHLKFHCPVPTHGKGGGDKDRSASLTDSGVLKCHAGCSFADVMKGLREASGRRMAPERSERAATPKNERTVATYLYRSTDGRASAEKRRIEWSDPESAKGYRKRFTWNLPPGYELVDMALWGLDSVPPADDDTWVEWVEGEKCQAAFTGIGHPAVCHGGSSSQKEFGSALEPLRGRNVRIWPDNDKAGIDFAVVVQRALKPLARRVQIMAPVGGPGGDIADFIQGGGDVERLLTEALLESRIDYLDDDAVRVRICPTDAEGRGEIAFILRDIEESGRDLNCRLSVEMKLQDAPRPLREHRNLLSPSAREGLVRVLGKHFGKVGPENWTVIVNQMVDMVTEARESAPLVDMVQGSPETPQRSFVLDNMIVEGGGTILYGPPKRGKSMTCLAIAVAIDAGLTRAGLRAPRARRVLYINLERATDSMRARLARANLVLGLPETRPIAMVNRRGSALPSLLAQLRRDIKALGIEVVVLDSISRSGFGDLNDNKVANSTIDGLNSLGVSWLAIGHTPRPSKENKSPHLFGSIHQDAGADAMVSLTSKQGDGWLRVALKVTDANDFKAGRLIELMLEFDEEDRLTRLTKAEPEVTAASPEEDQTHQDKVVGYLAVQVEGCTADTIARATGLTRQRVSTLCNAMAKSGITVFRKDGRRVYWQLREVGDTPSEQLNNVNPLYKRGGSSHVHISCAEDVNNSSDVVQFSCSHCRRTLPGTELGGFWPVDDETVVELCESCFATANVSA